SPSRSRALPRSPLFPYTTLFRAHGRRRRGAAPHPVAVHPSAQREGPHDRAHDALPRGGAGVLRPHRDAQPGAAGGAGRDARAAAPVQRRPARPAAVGRAPPGRAGAPGDRVARPRADRPQGRSLRCGGTHARHAARGGLSHRGDGAAARRPGGRLRLDHAGVAGVSGFLTLFYKEVLRFTKVAFQTVGAPIVSALLYLLIFGHVLEDRVEVFESVGYTSFLVPGLVMMSLLQNSFANA